MAPRVKLLRYVGIGTLILWLGTIAPAAAQSETGKARPANLASERLLDPIDSVYQVPAARLRFYRRLRRQVRELSSAGAADSLIYSYARSLSDAQQAYDHLLRRYRTADSVATHSLQQTQRTLGLLRQSLDRTQATLEHTTAQLEQLQKQLRREQRRSRWQRLMYGAGGIGVGVLVGAALR